MDRTPRGRNVTQCHRTTRDLFLLRTALLPSPYFFLMWVEQTCCYMSIEQMGWALFAIMYVVLRKGSIGLSDVRAFDHKEVMTTFLWSWLRIYKAIKNTLPEN